MSEYGNEKSRQLKVYMAKLQNTINNINEDILEHDECKACGELALLEKDLHKFINKWWFKSL